MKQGIEEAIKIGGALTQGDVKNAVMVLDDNRDGKISLGEIKKHRWTIIVILLCIGSAFVGKYFGEWEFVLGHWKALVGMVISFAVGSLIPVLFLERPFKGITFSFGGEEE